jgi:hypothetical protein
MSEPPKRDKFASMAAAQKDRMVPSAEASVTSPVSVPPQQRDKFASMAARHHQQQQPQEAPVPVVVTATPAIAAPKRDKFASMAARQHTVNAVTDTTTTTTTTNSDTSTTAPVPVITSPPPPKRDKFASLAARQSTTAPNSNVTNLMTVTANMSQEERQVELQARIQQRRNVLDDLETAEGLTWKLIHLARDTAHSLSDLSGMTGDILPTSNAYRETLQKIHQTLTPHGKFVKAYQNHQVDKTQDKEGGPNMYAARVEMRLAQEKKRVLEEMLRLERGEEQPLPMEIEASTALNKRKRDD